MTLRPGRRPPQTEVGEGDVAVQQSGDGTWKIIAGATGSQSTVLFVNPEFLVLGGYLTPLY